MTDFLIIYLILMFNLLYDFLSVCIIIKHTRDKVSQRHENDYIRDECDSSVK